MDFERILGVTFFISSFHSIMLCSNKITETQILSYHNWNGLFSNISHQMIIWLSSIVSRSKNKGYERQKIKKFALNSQLKPYQILTNNDQMLILCLPYFIIKMYFDLNEQAEIQTLNWLYYSFPQSATTSWKMIKLHSLSLVVKLPI